MKRSIAALLIVCTLSAGAQQNIDVLQYRFNIELTDASDTVYGQARITFRVLKDISSVSLDLKGPRNGKGMKVTEVVWDPFSTRLLSFTQQEEKLRIETGNLRAGDTSFVTIRYKGIPADGLIISKNKYGHRTFFSDNWPNRAHHWIPCVDDPADKAAVEFNIIAPAHYQVVSNGVKAEETSLPGNKRLTGWKEDVPLPTKVMVIGVADFAVNHSGDVGCVPVSSWVFPENKEAGFYDYAQAKEILAWYIDQIGPYAYKKLANVQSKTIFGGMENASAIFYYENSVSGERREEALLAHEIAHQWFGNHATEKSFAHLWLSEGFATYLTHMYLEYRYRGDTLAKRMQQDRDEVLDFVSNAKRPVVDSNSAYMQLLNANSYQKGGWILHMLRNQLGDFVFQKSIQEYYKQYGGSNADSKDLQRIFEQQSGKYLQTFFTQWLHYQVNPSLKVTWQYLSGQRKIRLTVQQLQKSPAFTFPLEVAIVYPDGIREIRKLDIFGIHHVITLTLTYDQKPAQLILDPNTKLLFEGNITEIK